MAENIVENFCVSRSDPASAICEPAWGAGNQLPGYAIFIAGVWLIGKQSLLAVSLFQSLVVSVAIARFAYAAFIFTRRMSAGLAAGLVLALSPLEIGFSRAMLTESLAIATTVWVFADLVLVLAVRRVRVLSLGAALAAAIFVRLDGVLLCLLTAGVIFNVYGFLRGLRIGFVLALIVAVPLVGWAMRSIAQGLPRYPPMTSTEHDWPVQTGAFRWGTTWVETSVQSAEFLTPMADGHYSMAKVPVGAYVNSTERKIVEGMLKQLAAYDNGPMPAAFDEQFAMLALERRTSHPFATFLTKPAARALAIWGDPYSSFGWPIGFGTAESLKIAHRIDDRGVPGLLSIVAEYPLQSAGKLIVNGYRFALLIAFGLIVGLRRTKAVRELSPIIAIAASYAVIRTVFFTAVFVPSVEIRYVVEALPGIEVVCALAAASWILQQATNRDRCRTSIDAVPSSR